MVDIGQGMLTVTALQLTEDEWRADRVTKKFDIREILNKVNNDRYRYTKEEIISYLSVTTIEPYTIREARLHDFLTIMCNDAFGVISPLYTSKGLLMSEKTRTVEDVAPTSSDLNISLPPEILHIVYQRLKSPRLGSLLNLVEKTPAYQYPSYYSEVVRYPWLVLAKAIRSYSPELPQWQIVPIIHMIKRALSCGGLIDALESTNLLDPEMCRLSLPLLLADMHPHIFEIILPEITSRVYNYYLLPSRLIEALSISGRYDLIERFVEARQLAINDKILFSTRITLATTIPFNQPNLLHINQSIFSSTQSGKFLMCQRPRLILDAIEKGLLIEIKDTYPWYFSIDQNYINMLIDEYRNLTVNEKTLLLAYHPRDWYWRFLLLDEVPMIHDIFNNKNLQLSGIYYFHILNSLRHRFDEIDYCQLIMTIFNIDLSKYGTAIVTIKNSYPGGAIVRRDYLNGINGGSTNYNCSSRQIIINYGGDSDENIDMNIALIEKTGYDRVDVELLQKVVWLIVTATNPVNLEQRWSFLLKVASFIKPRKYISAYNIFNSRLQLMTK